MRAVVGILSVLAVLSLALPASAQATARSNFFTGADPRNIKSVPIDVSKAAQAFKMNNMMKTPTPQKAVSLTNLFPKFSMPSWPPRVGVPTLPQGTNPFQPNRPVGVNLFDPKK